MVDSSHTPSTGETAPRDFEKHPVGALVVDTARMRLGRVMGHEGPYLQLRPPGGGREWDVSPTYARLAKGDEVLRASVTEVSLATP